MIMKKDYKLYGASVLPAFIIFLITPYLFAQVFIDSVFDWGVILLLSLIMYKRISGVFLKKNAFRIFLTGFIAKYVGAVFLFAVGLPVNSYVFYGHYYPDSAALFDRLLVGIYQAVQGYTYYNKFSILFVLCGVIISFIAVFLAQLLFGFKKTGLKTGYKILFSFVLALLTAPYLYLIPPEIVALLK